MRLIINLLLFGYAIGLQAIEPYDSIKDLPFDSDASWFLNAPQLQSIIQEKSPKVVIEIGSWIGASTRFLAQTIEEGAKVYAIDTWKGSSNEKLHLKDPRLPFLYQLFLSNVKHAGLTDKIIPIRMESIEASQALNLKADLIYIDAAHDTPSVIADILHWAPHLNEDGVLCGDDWTFRSVRKAVVYCAKQLGKTIHAEGNFWAYLD